MRTAGYLTTLIALCAALSLGGCAASYRQSEAGGTERSGVRLDPTRAILIAVPNDGAYAGKQYSGSGQAVAHQLAAAFSKHAVRVDVADAAVRDRAVLLAAAKSANCGYVAVPVISNWEQRATEWSGRPSRLSIGVSVLDAWTGQVVATNALDSRSRIVSWTSTSPDSLLPGLFDPYVNGLYP